MSGPLCLAWPVAWALAASPSIAFAHENEAWAHGVTDGLALFVGSIQFLLPTLAIGLLAGGRGRGSAAIGWSYAGLALGVGAGTLIGVAFDVPILSRGGLAILGLLLALDVRLSGAPAGTLAFAAGALAGSELAASGALAANALSLLVGFVVLAMLAVAVAGALSARYQGGWQRVAIRVAGSWFAAISIISLALQMRVSLTAG